MGNTQDSKLVERRTREKKWEVPNLTVYDDSSRENQQQYASLSAVSRYYIDCDHRNSLNTAIHYVEKQLLAKFRSDNRNHGIALFLKLINMDLTNEFLGFTEQR
ncbi:hypothetical protein Glove_199g158 [Diversispora epigaea]|uniref:Uncharacterized protein n=1 Tax=Diversispora epigaea TaxID=1348612 RepID=A0A397IK45_9GLOM|nr:hypothetical protein Glove_199g158 [Diversispora epigaea]